MTAEPTSELTLPIHDLFTRHPGPTAAVASYYTEAARVCLDRHHHSPVGFQINGGPAELFVLAEWERTDARTRNAHANEIDATEAGAYACALGTVELALGMVAVHRAETATAADYCLAALGAAADDLEAALRLEVSAVDRGEPAIIAHRLNDKLKQAAVGRSNLPAVAIVVGFRARLIMLGAVERR